MTLAIRHHLDPATLMSFAAGSLGEPLSAVAAAHLEMCPHCRSEQRAMDLLGAALLDGLAAPLNDALARPALPIAPTHDGTVTALPRRSAQPPLAGIATQPVRVARRLGVDLDKIAWRRLGPGVWHCPLPLSPGATGDLRFLKIAAGKRMPEHGHGGTELTLVLEGTYGDENGRYGRGDVQDIDADSEHRPVADEATGCICLVASEKPAHFKRIIDRLLQPLTGM